MNSYKHTINHAYSALTNLVTELGKATTEDQRTVGMQHWKTLCLIMDRSLRCQILWTLSTPHRTRASILLSKAIKLDMKCLAKRLEGEKARLARWMELQASLEALLS